MLKKGDIVKGEKTNHPIIYLNEKDEDYFYGCIITHSSKKDYMDNVSLLPEHFEILDENKKPYKTQFENSNFVSRRLIKKNIWGPFKKTGKLSNTGIEFIEKYLKNKTAIVWTEYID